MAERPGANRVGNNRVINSSDRVKEGQKLNKKGSQAQLYEQNILNAIRTNNFFVGGNAPNSCKDSRGFSGAKGGLASALQKQKMQSEGSKGNTLTFRSTQQSQQTLNASSKLSEPGMVH